MANETSALRGEPQQTHAVAEDDYQSFSAALGASARGRAFLHEYARRNRHADTEVVLAALDRLESVARSQKAAPEAERIRQDLRALLDTIRSARPQIDSTPGAIKAATLAALIEFVQARIEALVQPMTMGLTPVPEPEQPELPIPQPGSAAQRTIALVQAIAAPVEPTAIAHAPVPLALRNFDPDVPQAAPPRSTKIIPEVNFIDSLFDQIDAKAKAASKAATDAASAEPAPQPAELSTAAQAIAAQAMAAQAVLEAIEMPGPVAEETASFGDMLALAETDDEGDTAGMAVSIARASNVAAIDASAAAIDEIVAAAAALMAEEALVKEELAKAATADTVSTETAPEPDAVEATFVETFVVEPEPAATQAATIVPVELEFSSIAHPLADAVSKPLGTGAAAHAMNNALAEIMALSEEERLALFT
jgi:hypothetical protein